MQNLTTVQIKDLPENTTPDLTDEIPTQSSFGGAGSTKKTSIQKIKDIAISDSLLKSNNLSDLNDINIAKTNLVLNNVDNTSDINKPISTATQTAINAIDNSTIKKINNLSDLSNVDTSVLNLRLGAGVKEQLNLANDLSLQNPCPNKIFVSFSSADKSVIFPLFNQMQSISNVGVGYIFLSNVGTNSFNVKKNDGTLLQVINQGQSFYFSPYDNLSGNPDFYIIDASIVFDNANLPTTNEKEALVGTAGSPSSTNKYVTDNDNRLIPSNNLPTNDEKAALVGTVGPPSATNKYVTNNDPRLSGKAIPLSQTLYISKVGNDTNATGTYENPYATYNAAISAITDNSLNKIYNIVFTAGEYTETNPLIIKPFVNLTGESFGSVFLNFPSLSIDSGFGVQTNQKKYLNIVNLNIQSSSNLNFNQFQTIGSYGNIEIYIADSNFSSDLFITTQIIPLNIFITDCIFDSNSSLNLDNCQAKIFNCIFNYFLNYPYTTKYLASNISVYNSFVGTFRAQNSSNLSTTINFYNSKYNLFILQGTSSLVLNIDAVSYSNEIIPQNGSVLNLITKSDYINANYTPSHYSAIDNKLKSHLIGIDDALINTGNVNADWNATSGAAEILNKPILDTNNTPNTLPIRDNFGDFSANYPIFNKLNIGIKKLNYTGIFLVGSEGVNSLSVDTAPTWNALAITPSLTYWQSFTNINAGKLTSILFYFQTTGFSPGNYEINIFLGNGNNGSLLYTETLNISISGVYTFTPTNFLYFNSNIQYTVEIKSNPAITPIGGILYTNSSYTGGRSNLSALWNYKVEVYTQPFQIYQKIDNSGNILLNSDVSITQNEPLTITQNSYNLSFNPNCYLLNNSSNGIYTLPQPIKSKYIYLKKISVSNFTCTINTVSGQIDGQNNQILTTQYSSILLKNDGTNYFIF